MSDSNESGESRQLRNRDVPVLDNNRSNRQRTETSNSVPANNGEDIFKQHVDLTMDNIEVHQSNTPGVLQRRPYNPNSQIMSLQDYIQGGTQHGKNLLLIILSISAVPINSMTQYQQKNNGSRGNLDMMRHDRKMFLMCPLSPSRSNTALILFGAGTCERFFEGDISLRDNGAIRKYSTQSI